MSRIQFDCVYRSYVLSVQWCLWYVVYYAESKVSHIRDMFWLYAIHFVYEYCNHV